MSALASAATSASLSVPPSHTGPPPPARPRRRVARSRPGRPRRSCSRARRRTARWRRPAAERPGSATAITATRSARRLYSWPVEHRGGGKQAAMRSDPPRFPYCRTATQCQLPPPPPGRPRGRPPGPYRVSASASASAPHSRGDRRADRAQRARPVDDDRHERVGPRRRPPALRGAEVVDEPVGLIGAHHAPSCPVPGPRVRAISRDEAQYGGQGGDERAGRLMRKSRRWSWPDAVRRPRRVGGADGRPAVWLMNPGCGTPTAVTLFTRHWARQHARSGKPA